MRYQILLLGEPASEESFTIASDSSVNGGGRETPGDKGNAFGSMKDEVLRDEETRTAIVDPDEVIL